MNFFRAAISSALIFGATVSYATDVDSIISKHHEIIGGEAKLRQLKGIKMVGEMAQGSLKFPLEVVQLSSGKEYTKFVFQGKDYMSDVFDGETLWSINYLSQKPEKAKAEEANNKKLDMNDFPSALLDYKKKGYTAELTGSEIVDGEEAFKVKLTMEPITIEGKQVPNIAYYYFDKEARVLVMMETEIKSGPAKGKIIQLKMSDYQEVDGIYFPFSTTQNIKGSPSSNGISFKTVTLNPSVDNALFAFPVNTQASDKPMTSKAVETTKK